MVASVIAVIVGVVLIAKMVLVLLVDLKTDVVEVMVVAALVVTPWRR